MHKIRVHELHLKCFHGNEKYISIHLTQQDPVTLYGVKHLLTIGSVNYMVPDQTKSLTEQM